jgi:hypothetical protein
MPDYKPYPNEKNTPNRKTRKGERAKTFLANKAAGRKLRNARKAERDARLEAQQALEEGTEE